MIKKMLQRLFGLTLLDRLVERAVADRGNRTVFRSLTRTFDLRLLVSEEERRRIPRNGPLIVVANHPTGAMEGLVVAALLESVRNDVRALSHAWFRRYPDVARGMILVDPAAEPRKRDGSASAARKSSRWVRDGGLLTVYPAGEVARFRCHAMGVVDPPWRPGVARIVRSTRATVLPVWIDGRNSLLFQLLAAIHPRLSALLLVRELLRKRGTTVCLRIGEPIPFEKLPRIADDGELTGYLRQQVERMQPQRAGWFRRTGQSASCIEAAR